MKKRLVIMIPLAAVVAAVMVCLLAARPWLVTNDPNTYDIRADAPVSIIFDQFDKTRGVYRIVNSGSEAAFCTNRFALQYQKNGGWYNVKADNSGESQVALKLEPGGTEYFSTFWRSGEKPIPGGEYRLVTPIKTGSGGDYWIAAPFSVP